LATTREKGDQTFDHTAVMATNEGSVDRVTEIDLSHSHTVLEFK
jgi:hypothetical protein